MSYLKKGGVLILEGFAKEQLGRDSSGPQSLDLFYSKDELLGDFSDCKQINIETREIELKEGQFHKGKASVVRCVCVR